MRMYLADPSGLANSTNCFIGMPVHGTVIAQGGRFGGWSLYVKDGVPAYGYNFLGMQQSNIVASKSLAPGRSTVNSVAPASSARALASVQGRK